MFNLAHEPEQVKFSGVVAKSPLRIESSPENRARGRIPPDNHPSALNRAEKYARIEIPPHYNVSIDLPKL